jgi:hypothetical protein
MAAFVAGIAAFVAALVYLSRADYFFSAAPFTSL